MGCIRVDKITEYLCEPLRKCLKDEDPYVRKTAAVCVAKLYEINAQLVEDQGFLEQLKDLLSDSNPMVKVTLHYIVCICASKIDSNVNYYIIFRWSQMQLQNYLKLMILAPPGFHWWK